MHAGFPVRLARATKASAQAGNGISSPAQTGSEPDSQWFARASRQLLGSDPGLNLSLLTGVPERTCYRYASGERPATEYIVAKLLRSEHGWQWLAALMDGSNAQWWSDMQRARRITAQLDAIDLD